MTDNKKMTAPVSSAPTDAKQPTFNNNTRSIADLPNEGNLQATSSMGEIELKTISMPELYDTAYPPKMPVVDGLV
jgi:hypothetical protein